MKRLLCLWLPHWPIQRLFVARPALKQHALVLHDAPAGPAPPASEIQAASGTRVGRGGPGARGRVRGPLVKYCSSKAWSLGIRPGMPLAEAAALLENRELSLHAEPHDPRGDQQALEALRQWCRKFSPRVGLGSGVEAPAMAARRDVAKPSGPSGNTTENATEGATGDCLLLEVSGLGPLFGGERLLAERVVEELRQQGYAARVAIADTLGSAWAVAHYGTHQHLSTDDPPEDAKSNNSGPSNSGPSKPGPRWEWATGAWIVPPRGQREMLARLPVEALRLEPRQAHLLRQLGLERVEQLWQLERRELAARLGASLLRRLDQALGTAEELLEVPGERPPLEARWEGEHPLTQRWQVEEVLRQLIQQVAAELIQRDQEALRLECWLESEQAETARWQLGLFRPTAEVRHLVELMQLQLERLTLPGPVERIRLAVPLTVPRQRRQQTLFAAPAHQGPFPVARLIDRLRGRLGEQSVLRPRLQADAQPEWAWRSEWWEAAPPPATGQRRAGGRGGRERNRDSPGDSPEDSPGRVARARRAVPGPRPLFLFCPPLPLRVVAVVPDGPPVRFCRPRRSINKNPGRSPESWSPESWPPESWPPESWGAWIPVAQAWGPERIETGWWRGPSVRRDYYCIATPRGHRFWIYRQRNDGQWYLHGEFG